jgi:hypothetical protein
MNAVKAAFQALSPDERQLVETRKVEGRRPADQWLHLLGQVAAFDELSDAARRGGHGFFARRFAKKHDVPNGLREFALPFLAILREDQDPQKPVDLFLDLSGATMAWKQVNRTPEYRKPPYHKVVDSFFADPWFQGHAHFADGAHVNFVVTDHVRSTKKTKRNPRGKIKTKVKNKKKTEVAVTLTVPTRNYMRSDPTAPQRGVPKAKVKAGDSRMTVKTSGVIQAAHAEATPGIELLIELISAAYERVEPARRKKL